MRPQRAVTLTAAGKKESDPAKAVRTWIDERVSNHMKLRGCVTVLPLLARERKTLIRRMVGVESRGVKVIEVIPKSPSGKLLRRSEFSAPSFHPSHSSVSERERELTILRRNQF